MSTIGMKELRDDIEAVIRRVNADGETIEVAENGEIIALIVPPPEASAAESEAPVASERNNADEEHEAAWAELRRLGEEISKRWPKGVSAVDAIRDQRRF